MADEKGNKEALVEEIGQYFEHRQRLTPLAGRIYALLVLCSKSGQTFDDIVELSKASKSSVSTNIKLLLETGNIEYYTKPGERKRYFRLSKNYLKIRLRKYKENTSNDLKTMNKIEEYNKQFNTSRYKRDMEFKKIYSHYLNVHIQNLESTIEKLDELEKYLETDI